MRREDIKLSWTERLPGLLDGLSQDYAPATKHYIRQSLARMAELADRYEDLSR